ncbi:MAG TPA: PEP/pyruvate-binding domain-containing protein, partial [Trebonia sp.]|nr:PEP/pyruvate-binding domain-containing protein [Trebonia sp.]
MTNDPAAGGPVTGGPAAGGPVADGPVTGGPVAGGPVTGGAVADAVVDLGAIRGSDAARVGPKMARLGQLAADGWRVPDGYAVTAGALNGWLPPDARAELARLFSAPGARGLSGGQEELARLAEAAREIVESRRLPGWLEDAVAAAQERLTARTGRGPGLRVAVRSSAVSEDGQAASFAGQYSTYLGVSGTEDVLLHIRRCWASGFSPHALAYRRRFGGASPVRVHDLAVGVLELVDARSAGVAFTLDPVTGDRSTLVVEGNWGYGESVVSGHVSPDHWTVDRASMRVLTARTGAKRTWAVAAGPAGRISLEPLPADLAGRPCLTGDEVRLICEQAAAIEAAAGGLPQDVEWAVARDRELPDSLYILQHRPETTWGPAAGEPGRP